MGKQIIYSAMKTPDGTLLESLHRHDYRTHEDKNGKHYMIDGGNDYIRCSVNGDEEFITLYCDDPIEKVREYMIWGRNYDENMKLLDKTEWVKLKDLNNDHLDVLIFYPPIVEWRRLIFLREKQYRNLDMEGL